MNKPNEEAQTEPVQNRTCFAKANTSLVSKATILCASATLVLQGYLIAHANTKLTKGLWATAAALNTAWITLLAIGKNDRGR